MKDAYSFDADERGADISYQKMVDAYNRIFARCGLVFRCVEADSGNIGGSYSHEFMVIAPSGEDGMVYCSACEYAANLEKAEVAVPKQLDNPGSELLPIEKVYTPEVRSIEEVCAFLAVKPEDVVKTLVFSADGKPVAVLVRGDLEINEIKVRNYLGCDEIELASDDTVFAVTGSPKGFAGAIGVKVRIVADYSLINMSNFVMGANKEDCHVRNANMGRDFTVNEFADLRMIKADDACHRCRASLKFARGIEVGHVFKLGTKYSKAMRAVYLDQDGREKIIVMGCYGIGVGRTVAACIEQNHDDDGIIWPMPIAPYHVIVTPVNMNETAIAEAAESIYQSLRMRGVEVIIDDRDERAGVKFKDADLIGVPLRITIGARRLAEGKVEVRERKTGEVAVIALEEVEGFVVKRIEDGMS